MSPMIAQELEVLKALGLVTSAFLSLEQTHEFMGGKPALITLYKWAKVGKFPVRDHNGLKQVYLPDLLEWSAARKITAGQKPALPSQSRFQEVRAKLRSLKTEVTALPPAHQKETG